MAFTPSYQNDKKWENTKIGFSQSLTIGQIGCLLTTMAMTVNYFGGSETPLSLNERLKASNGFNDAWIKPANVPGMYPELGFKRQKSVECKNSPAPMAEIDAGLAAGSVVAVQVDREADATFEAEDGHWVLLYKKQGDDYLMWDPWYSETAPNTLVGRYGFGRKQPEDIIQSVIWHGKGDLPAATSAPAPKTTKTSKTSKTSKAAKPAPQSTPTAASADPLAVRPTVEQLTLRKQPRMTQTSMLQLLSTKDVLVVIEETGAARGKIGKQNQWLQVRDGKGNEGYVAAWYVRETAVPKTTAKTEKTPHTTITLQPTTASLSLRTAPRVADDTLITYLTKSSQLTLIDPAEAGKIGQQNQWVQVKTGDGQTGYVAAWYVKRV